MGTNAHVCLLILFAAFTEGIPVNRRIIPSPYWRNRPTALLHPHRKLSRPWLVRIQEELWREGSSGDGPEEGIQSILVSPETFGTIKINKNMYKTHSPSSRDFISSEEIPFPTIIDTRIEEFTNFENELISRISMPYRGPSSLLNTFIFRPSLSPFLIETPSEKASTSFYPFWLDESHILEMNTRQAISDKYSDHLVIVTAISAKHIYSDSEWTTKTTPTDQRLKVHSNFMSTITEVTLPTTQITNIIKVPSSISSISTLLPIYFNVNQFHSSTENDVSSSSHRFYSFKDHSNIDSEMFLNSSDLHASYFLSEGLAENGNKQFVTTYSSSPNNILFDSPNFILNTELNSIVANATFLVNSSILYDRNNSFHTVPPFHSFLLSNIQTTVTVVENRSDSDKFVIPTLTIHGTSTSADVRLDTFDGKVFTTPKSVETSMIPRIDSSFVELNDSIPVISLWPLDISSVVNVISHKDVKAFKTENASYRQSEKSQVKSRTDLIFHPIISSTKLFLSDNEIGNEENKSSLESSKVFEVNPITEHSTPFIPNLDHTDIPPLQEILSMFQGDFGFTTKNKSWINEIGSEKSHYLDILDYSPSLISNFPWIENNSLSFLSVTILPILSRIEDFSVRSVLSAGISTYGNEKSSANNEAEEKTTERGSAPEWIDSSTHHITARALGDNSDIGPVLQNTTSTESSKLIYTNISSPVTAQRVVHSLTKVDNAPTSLDSSFLPYKNSKFQVGANHEELSSHQTYLLGFNRSYEIYPQLPENKYSSIIPSTPIPSVTPYVGELENRSLFPDTQDTLTKLLTQSPLKEIEFVSISSPKIKFSQDILNTNQFHGTKKPDNSQIPYSDSFDKYEDLFTEISYFNGTMKLRNDSSNDRLESNTNFASVIEPSETLSEFIGKHKLEEVTSPYLIGDELDVKTSTSIREIESSIFLLHSSDNNLETHDMEVSLFTAKFISENLTMSNIPYLETGFSGEAVPLFKSYPKSNSNHTPKSLDMTARKTYFVNSFTTPTISWGIPHDDSKHRPFKTVSRFSSYRKPFTVENHSISGQSGYYSQIFTSEFIPSKQVSSRTINVSYSSTQDLMYSSYDHSMSSLSSHQYFKFYGFNENNNSDSNMLSTPSFTTNFYSEIYSFPISSTIFIAKSKFFILMSSSRFEDDFHTEVHLNQLESSLYFPQDLNSKLESAVIFQTPELIPMKSIITTEELSYLISSCTIFPEKAETLDVSKTNDDILLYQSDSILPYYSSIIGDHKVVENFSDFSSQGNKESNQQHYTSKIMDTKTVKYNYSVRKIENLDTEFVISKTEYLSNSYGYFVKNLAPENIESDHLSYTPDSQVKSKYLVKIPEYQSITSDYFYIETDPIDKLHSYPMKSPIPQSIDLAKKLEFQSTESNPMKSPIPQSIDLNKKLELQSTESNLMKSPIPQSIDLTRKLELQSTESNVMKSSIPQSINPTKKLELQSTESNSMKSPIPQSINLTKKLELQSTESNAPQGGTKSSSIKPSYLVKTSLFQTTSTKLTELQSINSDYHVRSTQSLNVKSSYIITKPDFRSVESGYLIRKPDPQSIESDYSTRKPDDKSIESRKSYSTKQLPMHPTTSVTSKIRLTPQHRQPASSYFAANVLFSSPTKKEHPTIQSIKSVLHYSEVSRTWHKEISTSGYSVEMASVMAISSFFSANNSRNASSFLEDSESNRSKTEAKPTPPIDLTLFKDNNYWILTILEVPMKGRLPENFSHTMETRLANAYSEAFRNQRAGKGSPEAEDQFVVKILSLTSDLLLNQLDIVYVVEQAGVLIPATVAAEHLNFLRHEQLREFLGLYAILKAKPYRPSESHPTTSALPMVTIVCSVLGFLLFIFCCFCVYCRCCRPKQAEDTASRASSASGSLQRSLEKHGQHNRKHLFREMITEMVPHEEPKFAPETYVPEGKDMPPSLQTETIDKAMKMLKILESKDASTSPIAKKRDPSEMDIRKFDEAKKVLPKLKKRGKELQDKISTEYILKVARDENRPPPVPKKGEESPTRKKSPDSGTSSRHPSSSLNSSKFNEEFGSDSSNTELLDLIAKSKADSEANVANTQVHLSKVRQRITELLDDAFALAGGRKFYGSLRSKRIKPVVDMFPRYASLRAQSAVARQEESSIKDRRPISEGGQQLLGAITDDGQLITRPPPKLVWDQDIEDSTSDLTKQEIIEAHNKHINFFPFQQQSKLPQISSASTSSSLPVLDTLHETLSDLDAISTTANVLRESTSEIYLAHSLNIHPAAVDQYDELDVVSALKEGEPVVELIQAIRKELQRFSGSLPENNYESDA